MSDEPTAREHGSRRWLIPTGWTVFQAAIPTTCRACSAPILFAVSDRTGKSSPFDPTADESLSVSHFATCPDAARFRKKR